MRNPVPPDDMALNIFHSAETVRFYVGLEEYFERMAVRQPVDELLVGSVVGLVEAFVDRRARSVVEMETKRR